MFRRHYSSKVCDALLHSHQTYGFHFRRSNKEITMLCTSNSLTDVMAYHNIVQRYCCSNALHTSSTSFSSSSSSSSSLLFSSSNSTKCDANCEENVNKSNNISGREEIGKETVANKTSLASKLLELCSFRKAYKQTELEHIKPIESAKWVLHERLDFLLQFELPSTWDVQESVHDNCISIQCTPHIANVRKLEEQLEREELNTTSSRKDTLVNESTMNKNSSSNKSRHVKDNQGDVSIHGISINCFSYKHKVPHTDHNKLLQIFLKRFATSVNNSLQVIEMSSPSTQAPLAHHKTYESTNNSCKRTSLEVNEMLELESEQNEVHEDHTSTNNFANHVKLSSAASSLEPVRNSSNKKEECHSTKQKIMRRRKEEHQIFPQNTHTCEWIASQLECAIAEITFQPFTHGPIAHGYCRVFYNSNRRFHYIVVVAVPESEFATSKDFLIHALAAVTENKMNVVES